MAMENTVDEEQLCQFVGALRQHTAFDLSDYSERSLRRRIAKLLDDERIPLSSLLQRIALDPCYGERVMNRITVNTSELFRDPPVWITLRRSIYPSFRTHSQINVWHAGCSMGQEVYSDMMLCSMSSGYWSTPVSARAISIAIFLGRPLWVATATVSILVTSTISIG